MATKYTPGDKVCFLPTVLGLNHHRYWWRGYCGQDCEAKPQVRQLIKNQIPSPWRGGDGGQNGDRDTWKLDFIYSPTHLNQPCYLREALSDKMIVRGQVY